MLDDGLLLFAHAVRSSGSAPSPYHPFEGVWYDIYVEFWHCISNMELIPGHAPNAKHSMLEQLLTFTQRGRLFPAYAIESTGPPPAPHHSV